MLAVRCCCHAFEETFEVDRLSALLELLHQGCMLILVFRPCEDSPIVMLALRLLANITRLLFSPVDKHPSSTRALYMIIMDYH